MNYRRDNVRDISVWDTILYLEEVDGSRCRHSREKVIRDVGDVELFHLF